MRLYAAIVSEESDRPETKALYGLGKAVKQLERLRLLVEEAALLITNKTQALPMENVGHQAVFVAPEYFFSNRRYMNNRFFSRSVKEHIITSLVSLASRHPKLLIIPGTVLSTKALYDTAGGARIPNASRGAKAVARINAAGAAFGTETNQLGWSHNRDTPSTETLLAQNTAYILLGKHNLKYHKVGNYMEVDGENDEMFFVPGSIAGLFSVGGVKYALEVCMDHALGAVQSTLAGGKVDVQIIVSSYVSARENPNASVTIHSSTEGAAFFWDANEKKGTSTGTNQIRFDGSKAARLAAPPVRKEGFTLWTIDINTAVPPTGHYTLSGTNLPSISTVHAPPRPAARTPLMIGRHRA